MKNLMLYALSLGMVGCASITNDTTHPMKVETLTGDGKAVAGAECKFTNDFATSTGKSGTTVPVRRSSKDLDINCTLAGQADANGRAVSRANAGMAGNILLGGGIGAIIDHNKGTAYTYPTWVQLVFGEARVFDRKDEKEGQPVAGTRAVAGFGVAAALSPQPAGTGVVRLEDAGAVPYVTPAGRERYREWLTRPLPRAFAVAANGFHYYSYGRRPAGSDLPEDVSERALAGCERNAKQPCKLYAVNNEVVWGKAP